MSRILIAGCGYVGSELAARLVRDGHSVWGLRRKATPLPDGVVPIEADLGLPATLRGLPERLEQVCYLAAPGGGDDALYRVAYGEGVRNLLDALRAQGQRPGRVLLASSTSVYGQREGEWVDEQSPTEPRERAGRRVLEAEEALAASPFSGAAVRFGGIYGPRRTRLVESVRTGNARYTPHPVRYTNRIHRDDCAGALRHLLALPAVEGRYVAVDCEPAAELTVLNWLAGALGSPLPRAARYGEKTGREGNKRCRNARLLASGYRFRYPTFREGYTAVLSELVPGEAS